jgi:hypothetical protein
MNSQSKIGENVVGTLKTFLAVMPLSILVYGVHSTNHLFVGLACVVGVLLQALIPPHGQRLFLLLTTAILFTIVYSAFDR